MAKKGISIILCLNIISYPKNPRSFHTLDQFLITDDIFCQTVEIQKHQARYNSTVIPIKWVV